MSGGNDVDVGDLDADFLRLQQELAKLPTLPPPPPPEAPPPPATKSSVVVKAEASAKPAWQLGLLERDRIELKQAAAVRKEADEITGKAVKPEGNDSGAPNGEWKWSGARWEWKMASPISSNINTNVNSPPNNANAGTAAPAVVGTQAKRMAAGDVWTDATLCEWPANDFRIFCGDLAPDATDEELTAAFGKYASFNMARVVKDKRTGKCRGYGFVSFAGDKDMVKALREMNGKYVGSRPVKLKRSNWQKRNLTHDRKKVLKAIRTIAKNGNHNRRKHR